MEKAKLESMIASGMSIRQIAKAQECSIGSVRHWLAKWGLKTEAKNDGLKKLIDSICIHCGLQMKDLKSSFAANHIRWCDKNPKRSEFAHAVAQRNVLISKYRKKSNQFMSGKQIGHTQETIDKMKARYETPEQREEASKKIRDYLDAHPESVGWRHHGKWKKDESYPESFFRQIFERNEMNFLQEHQVKRFSLDFAFPGSMICVEVDGDQHLAEWHKRRDERRDKELANMGWKTVRILWSEFSKMNDEMKKNFVDNLIEKCK